MHRIQTKKEIVHEDLQEGGGERKRAQGKKLVVLHLRVFANREKRARDPREKSGAGDGVKGVPFRRGGKRVDLLVPPEEGGAGRGPTNKQKRILVGERSERGSLKVCLGGERLFTKELGDKKIWEGGRKLSVSVEENPPLGKRLPYTRRGTGNVCC